MRCLYLHSFIPVYGQFPTLGIRNMTRNLFRIPSSDHLLWKPSISFVRYAHYDSLNNSVDERQAEVLKMFGITEDDCKQDPKIYHIHPHTLQQHGMVLLEGGFKNVTVKCLVHYFKMVRKDVGTLKEHDFISKETSVVDSFLSHLDKFPAQETDLSELKDDDKKYIDIYNTILKHFLIWRLEISEAQLSDVMKTYTRIKHRSLKYISWNLDILEHDIGFTKDKIRKNGYLIHSFPFNTVDTLKRVPQLCGLDIKTVFKLYPKIVMTATDTLIEIQELLKKNGIPNEVVRKRFDIFTLGSASLQQRLNKLKEIPEWAPYISNPRVIELLHYQTKAFERLNQLQEMQRQCISLHVLTSPQALFERFSSEGTDRTRGTDIVNFLVAKLDAKGTDVRKELQRHPFWCNVPLKNIGKTLECLKNKSYENDVILKNIPVILYPFHLVEQILSTLSSHDDVIEALKLQESNPFTNSKNTTLTKANELALCVYFLEKEHHFTGNGVWIK